MSKTKSEIRDLAANELGVLPLNGSLQSQDATRIETAYNVVYAKLKSSGDATWASTGSVPDAIVDNVVSLVAASCANTYGVSDSRYIRIKTDATIAEKEIRKYTANNYVSQSEAKDY